MKMLENVEYFAFSINKNFSLLQNWEFSVLITTEMDINQIYCDGHFPKYTCNKSLCCIPETNN